MKTYWIIPDNGESPVDEEFQDYERAIQRAKELTSAKELTHVVVELRATVRQAITVEEKP